MLTFLLNKKNTMLRLCFCFSAVLLLAFVVGCGNGNVGLSGTVTFSDDGSPVTAGTIGFRKDGRIARGNIREDGTYIVGFEREADGLPPGRYEVFISGADKVIGMHPDGETEIREPLIDPKYTSADTSGLVVDVDASTRVYNIEVDRYRGRARR